METQKPKPNVFIVPIKVVGEVGLAGGNTGTVLGLDIAKNEIVGCVRWGTGVFERPWPNGVEAL